MKGFWALLCLSFCLAVPLAACGGPAEEAGPLPQGGGPEQGEQSSAQPADFPPVIQVDGIIYLYNSDPVPGEVDESAVIGRTTAYTDGFPSRDGETNFNRELDMPYARVGENIAVLYQQEWRLCTPYNG